MKRIFLALLFLFLLVNPSLVHAQAFTTGGVVDTTLLPGTYTVSSLPACISARQGKYAFVTDLGGGADTIICDGLYWKHIRLGTPALIDSTSGVVNVTPLTSAPVLLITSNISTMNIVINTSNLYPGYLLYVRMSGLVTGTLGIKINGQASLPILGNTTSLFIYDGVVLQRIQ